MLSLQAQCRRIAIEILRWQFVKSSLKLLMKLPRIGFRNDPKVSISELDRIMDRAKNLDHFFKDTSIQNEYYSALKKYFSSKNVSRQFPKKSFNAILEQMKILSAQIPEFSKTAWNKKSPGNSFRVQVKEQDCGRNVNPFLWRLYRYEWIETLKKQSKAIDEREIKNILIQTLKRIRAFEEELKESKLEGYRNFGVKRSHRKTGKILRNAFYVNLVKDENLKKAAATLLHQYLVKPQNKIFFELIDADLIIHFIHELRQNPKKVLPPFFNSPIPNALLSVIKAMIPNPQQLLSDQSIFPKNSATPNQRPDFRRVRNSEYITFPVRPFHAVWTGIFGKDCLGGDPTHLEKLCAARWAIPLLPGTFTEFVERNGKYQGFVRTVPLKHPLFSEPLRSIEVWVPAMTRTVLEVVPGQDQFANLQSSFFNLWFDLWLHENIHRDQLLVISDSKVVDNERVKDTIFLSKAYSFGSTLPQPHSLSPFGTLITDINRVLPPPSLAKNYFHGSLALDTSLTDVTKITVLNTRPLILNGIVATSPTYKETVNTRTRV